MMVLLVLLCNMQKVNYIVRLQNAVFIMSDGQPFFDDFFTVAQRSWVGQPTVWKCVFDRLTSAMSVKESLQLRIKLFHVYGNFIWYNFLWAIKHTKINVSHQTYKDHTICQLNYLLVSSRKPFTAASSAFNYRSRTIWGLNGRELYLVSWECWNQYLIPSIGAGHCEGNSAYIMVQGCNQKQLMEVLRINCNNYFLYYIVIIE